MFPSEMVILMAIAASGSSGKELITRPIDVASQYVDSLYNSLVWCGYLKRDSSEGCQLTSKGRETPFEFSSQNKNRKKDLQTIIMSSHCLFEFPQQRLYGS